MIWKHGRDVFSVNFGCSFSVQKWTLLSRDESRTYGIRCCLSPFGKQFESAWMCFAGVSKGLRKLIWPVWWLFLTTKFTKTFTKVTKLVALKNCFCIGFYWKARIKVSPRSGFVTFAKTLVFFVVNFRALSTFSRDRQPKKVFIWCSIFLKKWTLFFKKFKLRSSRKFHK